MPSLCLMEPMPLLIRLRLSMLASEYMMFTVLHLNARGTGSSRESSLNVVVNFRLFPGLPPFRPLRTSLDGL